MQHFEIILKFLTSFPHPLIKDSVKVSKAHGVGGCF